jgi:hypothetical protein
MSDMAEAHRRDYSAKNAMDEASRALRALLANPDTIGRLQLGDRDKAQELARDLEKRSAQIVRTWD